jgi:ribulose-phosphate 3-epimerase
VTTGAPQISASILTADFARLGSEVDRAVAGGVDSIHVDVMDGHFVDAITLGPKAVHDLRGRTSLPFHSHLMVSRPLGQVGAFASAGSDLIVFHVEADDDPADVIAAIRAAGRSAGLAINPETPAEAALPWLARIDLLLVMTVHPGQGGQAFLAEVLPKLAELRAAADRSGLRLPIGVDGGIGPSSIGPAHRAGAEVLVTGSALYQHAGDLAPVVAELRAAARTGAEVRG